MKTRKLPLALMSALWLVTGAAVVPSVAFAADDQCVEQCDEEADTCMSDAGEDEKKQKDCDEKYEACQAKC